MPSRRAFVKIAAGAALSPLFAPVIKAASMEKIKHLRLSDNRDVLEIAQVETYWEVIQRAYKQDASFINIESGFFSPAAEVVLNAQIDRMRQINQIFSFYMRRKIASERENLKQFIGHFIGGSPEEMLSILKQTSGSRRILDLPNSDDFFLFNQSPRIDFLSVNFI